jgi:hypothetical protein
MPDDVFSPFPHGSSVAPGSAEVIYLKRALFVIKGQFFDPIANADAPLPPHRWAIAHSETVFAESATSDADGVATIFEPDTTGVPPDGDWDLYLIPIFDGRPDSDIYATSQEAWIDVTNKKWVPNDQIGEGSYRHLAREKLLRIPLWSTKRKAERGGGFVGTFPHGSGFATTGLVKTSELLPHGTHDSPWVMQVDHGWLRTHVALRCYDPVAKADRSVPQGVLLIAKNGFAQTVGGSSCLLPNGSIYVVNAGLRDNLADLFYQFETPEHTWFQFSDGAMSTTPDRDLSRLATHYLVPRQWGGPVHEAWVGPDPPNATRRKRFAEIRHEGTTSDRPVCFHLDDLVFTKPDTEPILVQRDGTTTFPSSRLCVLDHTLAIRGPASNPQGTVPYSQLTLTRYPLRAEEAFYVNGQGFEKITRAIDYEGRLYTTMEDRARGLLGFDPYVGARAARPSLALTPTRHEVHLFDTPWMRHTYQGTAAKLAHLVIYVPAFVTAPAADDMPGGVNAARTNGVPRVEHHLFEAARVWDQTHPSNPSAPTPAKDYVIFSAAGLTAEKHVVKVRHHFGCRANSPRIERDGTTSTSTMMTIQVHPQAGRATGGDPMHLYLKYGSTILAPPVNPHPAATPPYDFEPSGSAQLDPLDQVSGVRNTIAHELGHSMGLPDEYTEHVDPPSGQHGQVAAFQALARPYELDAISMMQGNRVPRLRYDWRRVRNLVAFQAANARPEFQWIVDEAPFIAQYIGGGKTLRYTLPPNATPFAADPDPWTSHPGRTGLADLALFMASDDESTRGPIIRPPSAAILDTPFDGVLVVNPKFWFTFDGSISDVGDRWEVMYDDFAAQFYDVEKAPKFVITSSGGTGLHRVCVLLQPRFEFGPNPSMNGTTPETVANADIEVRVRSGGARSRTATGTPHVLSIRKGDVGRFLMRYALSPTQAIFDARDNSKLEPADLRPVNVWFAAQVNRTTTLSAL